LRPQHVGLGGPLRGNGQTMVSRPPVNIGVIGCGERARFYLRAGGELFRCVACCDLRREAAEALRSEWHFGAAYTDPARLLRRNDIDLVLLLTPPSAYPEWIPAAAQAGKHIYLEGPWVASRETVQKVLEACQSAAVHLGMAHPRRALPRIVAAKRVLESGLLGAPFLGHWETARLHRWPPTSDEAGTLPNCLSEALAPEIDVLCFLVQQPVQEVYARAGRAPFRPDGEGETWAALTLTLGPGMVVQMFHSWDCQSEQRAIESRFHLECTQGTLFVNEEGPDTVAAYLAPQRAWLRPDLPEFGEEIRQSLEAFVEGLSEGVEAEPLAADQLQLLEVTWAVAESLKRNVPVAVPSRFSPEPLSPEAEPVALSVQPPRPRRRFRRARLSPADLARYAARPVPQFDPPVLALPALPLEPPEGPGDPAEPPPAAEDRDPDEGAEELPHRLPASEEEPPAEAGPGPGEEEGAASGSAAVEGPTDDAPPGEAG
jgi:predicted dehydrogenase